MVHYSIRLRFVVAVVMRSYKYTVHYVSFSGNLSRTVHIIDVIVMTNILM